MLSMRVASAAVLLPIVLAAVYAGGPWLAALALVIGLAAMVEYLLLSRALAPRPLYALGLSMVLLWLADALWPAWGLGSWALTLLVLLGLAGQVLRKNAPHSLTGWALAVAGGLYIGATVSYFVRLRGLEDGLAWMILALVGTWICDSGAYFVGRNLGKHRFFPEISPKKTLEGALGGLISGVLAVMLIGWLMLDVPLGWGALLGLVVVLAATFGDLAESVIKRQVGVKDSSHLIPGHGGVLDRVDSLLFVVPIVYCFATLILGAR